MKKRCNGQHSQGTAVCNKLVLARHTVRPLSDEQLADVQGGTLSVIAISAFITASIVHTIWTS